MSESEAQAEIQTIATRSAAAFPETNKNVGAYSLPLSRQLTEEVRPALLLVWAAIALVLLIACANVAHLMMGRMFERVAGSRWSGSRKLGANEPWANRA